MLPLQSPLEAYRADLSRHPNRTDFGRSDTVWLLVAHCLHRLSRAQGDARRSIADNCASAIGDLAGTVSPDPFVPYTVAAVELAAERMVVLGQLAPGVDPESLELGMEMELVLDTLFEDAEAQHMIWKWRPVAS